VMLEARNITFSFGHTLALRGATVILYPGETLAVMGPSGSGKSTLLQRLAGISCRIPARSPLPGRRLDTLEESPRSELRWDRFGFVFQFGQLVPELTAQENVALPLLFGGTSRRVVALETAVPLVLTATVSIAVGFLAAQLFLHAQLDQPLSRPVRSTT